MNMELRVQDAELKANTDGTMTVSGYVNKTNQLSNTLGVTKRFVEKISKGVFTRAIQSAKRDIDFLAEHNSKLILASTRNNSLKLTEDEQGLFMEATITPTSWGKDYYELINSGIYRNMSFGFRTIKDSWRSLESSLYERTIEEMELFEVSVVKDPAYSQSTIAARGIDLVEEVVIPTEVEEENRNMEKIMELLKSLEERVGTLVEEVKELRTAQETKDEEVRKEEKEESETTEDEAEKSKDEKEKEEKSNDEKAEDEEERDEKSEDSEEEKEIEKKADETEKEEDEEEQERSIDETPDFSEYRNRLASLK